MLAEVSENGRESRVRGEIVQQLERILQEKNLDNVRFLVKFVKEILPDPCTGKKQLIVEYVGER